MQEARSSRDARLSVNRRTRDTRESCRRREARVMRASSVNRRTRDTRESCGKGEARVVRAPSVKRRTRDTRASRGKRESRLADAVRSRCPYSQVARKPRVAHKRRALVTSGSEGDTTEGSQSHPYAGSLRPAPRSCGGTVIFALAHSFGGQRPAIVLGPGS